jgi:hypothetical protein
MKYALYLKNTLVHVTNETPYTGTPEFKEFSVDGQVIAYDTVKELRRLSSLNEAVSLAKTISEFTGNFYIPCDEGEHCSPRFGILLAPKIDDDVSYTFNGDYYPCGKIVRITPSYRIFTKDDKGNEHTFYRKGIRSNWVMKGGTWSLVPGIISEQNPSF